MTRNDRATATDVGYVSLDVHKRTLRNTYYFYFAPEDTELEFENCAPGHTS